MAFEQKPASRSVLLAPLITCLLSAGVIVAGLYLWHSGWAALLLYHCVLLGAMILGKPSGKPDVIFRGFSFKAVFFLVLLSLATGWMFYDFIHRLDPHGTYVLRKLSLAGFTPFSLIPFLFYVSVINPVLEEFYWRRNYAESGGGIFDVFYALLHIPMFCFFGKLTPVQLIIPVAGLVMAGALWRMVAGKVDGLASSIIGHGTGDFAMVVAILLIVK